MWEPSAFFLWNTCCAIWCVEHDVRFKTLLYNSSNSPAQEAFLCVGSWFRSSIPKLLFLRISLAFARWAFFPNRSCRHRMLPGVRSKKMTETIHVRTALHIPDVLHRRIAIQFPYCPVSRTPNISTRYNFSAQNLDRTAPWEAYLSWRGAM